MYNNTHYVLVTLEDDKTRVPKVLEDYIYSLNIFDDVIHISELSIGKYLQTKNIYVFTQMWLHTDNLEQQVIDNMLSQNRCIYLNVEMLSEEIRGNHILNLIKENVQIADYSIANISYIQAYAKDKGVEIKKPIIYLPYQFNLQDQIQLYNKENEYEYDVGIINALPKKSDTVNPSLTYRRTKLWNDLQNRRISSINIMGWGKERDTLIRKCKVIINVHHFECFNIFEHIRCDRLLFANKIVLSDESILMNDLDVFPHVQWCKFDNILDRAEFIVDNFEMYQSKINTVGLKNLRYHRCLTLRNELDKKILTNK